MEAMVFGYCTEGVFHRGATNLLESSGHLDTTNSDGEGCIGRMLAVVDGVEGSCAERGLVDSDKIPELQKISHLLIRILIRSMDVCFARH